MLACLPAEFVAIRFIVIAFLDILSLGIVIILFLGERLLVNKIVPLYIFLFLEEIEPSFEVLHL